MLSNHVSLVGLIKLLDELTLTYEESTHEGLNLRYDNNLQTFVWNTDIDLSKYIIVNSSTYFEILPHVLKNNVEPAMGFINICD